MKSIKSGFTLIEIIIFVSVLSVFFIMVFQMSTASLATLKTNERRLYATRYAEEILEWLSAEKEGDWEATFLPKAVSATPTIYCFNAALTTWPTAGTCPSYALNGLFKREVALSRQANTTPGDYQVTAVVTVSWQQGSGAMSVPVTTIYNRYE